MTPQVKEWITEFLNSGGHYLYPQPAVAKSINETQVALNTWRKDKVLWGDGWEKSGRIMYTAEGVIAAGLMSEFSWHFGPKNAAHLVAERINWVMELRNDKQLTFLDQVAYRARTGPSVVTITAGESVAERHYDGSELYLITTTQQAMADRDLRQGSVVIFPLGALVAKWSLRMLSIMDCENRAEAIED